MCARINLIHSRSKFKVILLVFRLSLCLFILLSLILRFLLVFTTLFPQSFNLNFGDFENKLLQPFIPKVGLIVAHGLQLHEAQFIDVVADGLN